MAGAVVELVAHLLDVAPHLRVLATSRVSLGVDGGQELPVSPLAPGAARELFVERADDATGRPLTSADLPHVGAIVDRVDRLPLAIELAAAWTRSLSAATVATRLADNLDLLDQRVATSVPHTLREVVARSLDLLSALEATMFERLAVFSGGWTLQDAEAVCGGDGIELREVVPLLAALAQQSLVVVEQGRYRMLTAIQELASERLASSGAGDRIRYTHARHFLAMAGGAEAGLRGPEQSAWLDRLLASAPNTSAALAWARRDDRIHPDEVLLAAGGLGWFWFLGRHGDGRRELAAALEATSNGSPWARARALQAHSIVRRPGGCIVHPHPEADRLALVSRDLLSAAGDQPAALLSEVMGAVPAVGGTSQHEALRTLADAAEAFRRQGDRWAAALADFVAMEIEVHQGSIDAAVEVGERARDGFEQVGDAWGTSSVALHLGHGLRLTGRYDGAASLLESGREEATRVGLRNTLTGIHVDLARLALHGGDMVAARRSVDRVRSLASDLGNRMLVGMAEVLDAALQLERGRLDLARELTRSALARFENEDVPSGTSEALSLTAWLEARRGDLGAAERHATRARDVARAMGDRGFEARALEVTSLTLALRGDRDGATTASGRAGRLRLDGNRPASRTEAMVIDELTDVLDEVAR